MRKPTDIPSKRRAGRHDESKTIRWRERKLYQRIDRHGNPVPYTAKEIAEMRARQDHNAPPQLFPNRNNPIPDNVTSITKNSKPDKPVATSGNEAESREFKPAAEYDASTGLIAPPKGEVIKRNHNPGLSDEPVTVNKPGPTIVEGNKKLRGLDPKFYVPPKPGSTVAPSGLPISAFLEGGKYSPPETTVVYTTEDGRPANSTLATTTSPPPTPTRDWRSSNAGYAAASRSRVKDAYWSAANDPDARQYLAKRLTSYVQWFINHVEPQNWESKVHNLVSWRDGEMYPNTGAINKAAARMEDELAVHKSMNDSYEREWRMLDGALTDAHSEINLLRQELQATQAELKNLEFVHAHSIGDYESAQQIAEELLGTYTDVSKAKSPPEDADKLLSDYKLHDSFVRVDGPEFAFARLAYGDPRLGQVIRDQADMKLQERMHLFNEREALRRIASNVRNTYTNMYGKYPEIKRFRECAALYRISDKVKAGLRNEYERWWETRTSSLYYSRLKHQRLEHDSLVMSKWGKKVTPLNRKKPVNYQQVINKVVGVHSFCYTAPHLVDYHKEIGIEHRRHMNTRMAKHYLSQTKVGTVVKAYNKVIDWMNTEVNPVARKRMKQEQEEQRLRKQAARQRKMQRRADRATKAKQQKSRAFDAELSLKSRGFVIVDR